MNKNWKSYVKGYFLLIKIYLAILLFCFPDIVSASQETTISSRVGFLSKGETLEETLKGNEKRVYKISLVSGQLLDLIVEQKGIDVVLVLLDEKGNKIREVDSPNGTNGVEPIYCIIENTGVYLLEIKSLEPEAKPGRYRLFINELRVASYEDKEKVMAQELFYEAHTLQTQERKESLESALAKYLKVLITWEKFSDLSNQEKCLKAIGVTYLKLGHYKNSIEYNERALKVAINLEDKPEQAVLFNEIALNHYYIGNNNESISFYKRALSLLESITDDELRALVLHNQGLAYDSLGNIDQAIINYEKALQVFISVNNFNRQFGSFLALGESYRQLGKISESLGHFNKARSLATQLNSTKFQIESMMALGKFYVELGEHQEGLEYYYKAFILNRNTEDIRLQATILNDLGVCYTYLQNTERAFECYNQSLKIFVSSNSKSGESAVYNNLGLTYLLQGKDNVALEYFSKALSLIEGDVFFSIRILDKIGLIYLNLMNFEKAYEIFNDNLEKSKKLGLRSEEISANQSLAKLYLAKGEYEKSRITCEKVLKLLDILPNDRIKIKMLGLLAKVNLKEKNYENASNLIDQALKLSELNLRKLQEDDLRTFFLSSVQDFYEFSINLHIEKKILDPASSNDVVALEVSEASRVRSLLSLIRERRLEPKSEVNKKLALKKDELQNLINRTSEKLAQISTKENPNLEQIETKKKLEAIKKEYFLIKNELHKGNFHYLDLLQEEVKIQNMQKTLDKDTLILEYFLGKDKSYLWVVARDYVKVYNLPPTKEIETLVAEYIRQMKVLPNRIEVEEQKVPQDTKEISEKIAKILISPIGDQLGSKRLIIVPHKILNFLPFAALPEPSASNTKKELPLVMNHEIIYLPSISLVEALEKNVLADYKEKKAIVVADPIFKADLVSKRHDSNNLAERVKINTTLEDLKSRGFELEELPGTHQEAKRIKEILKTYDVKLLLGVDSSLPNFLKEKLDSYNIIHFATHGVLNNLNPELSGLVFSLVDSDGNEQPGFLTTNQIFGLNLNADLVVLSACQTGVGKQVNGEGVLGLSRAFFYAGAKRIITTLWKVSDVGTSELMSKFYSYLSENNVSYTQALRQAQISMIQSEKNHPFYWAAFKIEGEWR